MQSIWDALLQSWRLYYPVAENNQIVSELINKFIESEDMIPFLKHGLTKGETISLSIEILSRIESESAKFFLPELVNLVSYTHGYLDKVRKIIISLPRAWVITHIEYLTEPYLDSTTGPIVRPYIGSEQEFGIFLELYIELDTELFKRLLIRTVQHYDIAVRDVGYWFVEHYSIKLD